MRSAAAAPDRTRTAGTRVALLAGAFAVAVALRVVLGGPGVDRSVPAALAFAAVLGALVWATGTRTRVDVRVVAVGVAGAVLVCAPSAVEAVVRGAALPGTDGLLRWTLVVLAVATAEEAFLRGSLHDAVTDLAGEPWAVAAGAVAFAALHVPLYGWHVVPLDLAVGVLLGVLRVRTGTFVAPAVAHVGADVGSWFLR